MADPFLALTVGQNAVMAVASVSLMALLEACRRCFQKLHIDERHARVVCYGLYGHFVTELNLLKLTCVNLLRLLRLVFS